MARVAVAMSGGVDSSVAAALLVDAGHDVIGIMLRLWSERGKESSNRCCTPDAMAMARRVAAKLDIPFYVIDAQEQFFTTVVNYFINGYAQGITPNPCLQCNKHIRWELLLNQALAFGAEHIATGHYARIQYNKITDRYQLLRSVDKAKDQSYVLHVLNQEQLSHSLLPIGGYTKVQVRNLALQYSLPVSQRPDSQDLCFLAGDDYRNFLQRHETSVTQPGPIITRSGAQLGVHHGLKNYTLGQRKGLGIAAPEPFYVIEKDLQKNALIVGTVGARNQQALNLREINWISGELPPDPFRGEVKIRYRSPDALATITPLPNHQAKVEFDTPQRDVTPGQAGVIYQGDLCIGGGIIE